jgi:hypothetical protein
MRPERGEHGIACEFETMEGPVAIVSTTQPLPVRTPKQDAGWAELLPAPAAPLLATLRAANGQPPQHLDPKGLDVGRPIRLVPAAVAATTLWPPTPQPDHTGPLWWFSRVAYTSDGKWALVYAAQVCTGVTAEMVPEAEPGAYAIIVLAALEHRSARWDVHDPLYLHVDLPQVEASPTRR